jgi:hypothetical protein
MSTEAPTKKSYKDTLNLFASRAGSFCTSLASMGNAVCGRLSVSLYDFLVGASVVIARLSHATRYAVASTVVEAASSFEGIAGKPVSAGFAWLVSIAFQSPRLKRRHR